MSCSQGRFSPQTTNGPFAFIVVSGDMRTSFLSGSTFNVTWHLAYPHRVSKWVDVVPGYLIKLRWDEEDQNEGSFD